MVSKISIYVCKQDFRQRYMFWKAVGKYRPSRFGGNSNFAKEELQYVLAHRPWVNTKLLAAVEYNIHYPKHGRAFIGNLDDKKLIKIIQIHTGKLHFMTDQQSLGFCKTVSRCCTRVLSDLASFCRHSEYPSKSAIWFMSLSNERFIFTDISRIRSKFVFTIWLESSSIPKPLRILDTLHCK